jgi:hypothetical protein
MPVLMAYGYGQEDLDTLVEDCVGLVSLKPTKLEGGTEMVVVWSWVDILSEDLCGLCYQDPMRRGCECVGELDFGTLEADRTFIHH